MSHVLFSVLFWLFSNEAVGELELWSAQLSAVCGNRRLAHPRQVFTPSCLLLNLRCSNTVVSCVLTHSRTYIRTRTRKVCSLCINACIQIVHMCSHTHTHKFKQSLLYFLLRWCTCVGVCKALPTQQDWTFILWIIRTSTSSRFLSFPLLIRVFPCSKNTEQRVVRSFHLNPGIIISDYPALLRTWTHTHTHTNIIMLNLNNVCLHTHTHNRQEWRPAPHFNNKS